MQRKENEIETRVTAKQPPTWRKEGARK